MSKTLLLADDSVTIQKVVGISFASEDVTLIAVDNGDDAIVRAREERPDVILADVVMPGKNGYEVCEAIKADPALAHIPVLLLTGTFEAFDADRAERVGAAGHIAKPFESQTLVDLVKKLLASSTAPAAAVDSQASIAQTPIIDEPAADPGSDAFDFFDDDLESADVVAEPEPLDTIGSLEFGPEAAFEFGAGDDLSPPSEAAAAIADPVFADSALDVGPTAEIPIAVSASPNVGGEAVEVASDTFDSDLDEDLSLDSELAIDADLGQPISVASELDGSMSPEDSLEGDSLAPLDTATATGDEPFDFSFESAPAESAALASDDAAMPLVEADDLAQATALDPEIGSDFDVSSSDLGPALGCEPTSEPDQTVLVDLESDDLDTDDVLEPELVGDLVQNSAEDIQAEPVISAEFASHSDAAPLATTEPVVAVSNPPQPREETPHPAPEATFEPATAPAIDASHDLSSGPSADPAPEPLSSAVSDTAARAELVLERIEPQLRTQIHDTLEKIAWESFGDLTEAIVRQSVQKVEEIAWEVVPQLIETLVREEIRKMKGEPASDE